MQTARTARPSLWLPLFHLPLRVDLLRTLVGRELAAAYRGSILGMLWALLTPLVMIAIFTFIFSVVFGARFGTGGSPWDYALYLFCGLLPWRAFEESVQQSSLVIVSHSNLVKRVVFPVETLPLSKCLTAVVNQIFGTAVLCLAVLVLGGRLHVTLLWLPLLILLQLAAAAGASWFLASLGVFIRDIVPGLSLVLMAWMYLTPIVYPESVVPEQFRPLLSFNPMAPLIRSYRQVILEGQTPALADWLAFAAFAAAVFVAGYLWFAKTRKNFADVI